MIAPPDRVRTARLETLPLDACDRIIVTERLAAFDGHRRRTAESLGMSPRWLGMRMARWGMTRGINNGRT